MLWWTLRQLSADDWKTREVAAQKMGELKDSKCVEPLIAALKDGHSSVRQMAEWALVQFGAEAVTSLAVALRNRNVEVRKSAASALAQIREPAVAALGMILNDPDAVVRETAALTLARIGTRGAIEQLTSALRYGDSGAKEAAASGLSRLGAKAVDPLVAALADNRNQGSDTAAAALVRIGKPAVPKLIASLRNSDAWEPASEALSRIDPDWSKSESAKSAVTAFIEALGDSDKRKRKTAAVVLGHIGDIAAIDRLIEVLSDEDAEVRENAATALAELGDPRAVPHLIAALRDTATETRAAAAGALMRLGAELVKPLVDALKTGDKSVRESAASVLVNMGHSVVEPLVEVLWKIDPDLAKSDEAAGPGPRFVAVGQTNGGSPDRGSTDPRQKIAQAGSQSSVVAPRKEVKRGLIKAVGSVGPVQDARDIQVLSHALEAPDPEARESAMKELFTIGTNPGSPLAAALRHKSPSVRRTAAHALAETGDARVREILRTELGSSSQLAVLDAAESLVKFGDLSLIRPLGKMLAALDDADSEGDPAADYKARRALGILQSVFGRRIEDVAVEDLDQIVDLKTRRAPRFLSVVQATVSGKMSSPDDRSAGILTRLKEIPEFKEVMELARHEQNRRKRNP